MTSVFLLAERSYQRYATAHGGTGGGLSAMPARVSYVHWIPRPPHDGGRGQHQTRSRPASTPNVGHRGPEPHSP